jgi:hypothetical protein
MDMIVDFALINKRSNDAGQNNRIRPGEKSMSKAFGN